MASTFLSRSCGTQSCMTTRKTLSFRICQRHLSSSIRNDPSAKETGSFFSFDPSLLVTEKAKQQPKFAPDAPFGTAFTDHMLSIRWTSLNGWEDPKIRPLENLSLHPATSALQYAIQCFEGTKAYRDQSGRLRLFRPEVNMQRFNRSAARLALPTFDPEHAVELLAKYVTCEERFVPNVRGHALYLRPTMISTEPTIAMFPPSSALFYVIACPVAGLHKTGQQAISLEATTAYARSWPNGMGDMKVGGNYGPCFKPQMAAASRGFHQNLWLNGPEQAMSEVGSMNLFMVIEDAQTGKDELITPSLDGTILPGVTRDSVLKLAKERMSQNLVVSERTLKMADFAQAASEGRVKEVFGTGTAAVILPVRTIGWNDQLIDCGLEPGEEIGSVGKLMKDWLEAIQYGDEDHPWSHVIR